jgi:hypothetical protein
MSKKTTKTKPMIVMWLPCENWNYEKLADYNITYM